MSAALLIEAVRRGSGGDASTLDGVLLVGGAILVVAFTTFALVRARRRRRLVHAAATEASLDEPHLAPLEVEREAAELFTAVQQAWDARDQAVLTGLLGADLSESWRLRMDEYEREGWQYRFAHIGKPHVDMVGLVNRVNEGEDRVTVQILCSVRPYLLNQHGRKVTPSDVAKLGLKSVREYWTLARRDGRWICMTIEGSLEGGHRDKATVVATPESDTARIRDEAVVELAVADAADAPGDLVSVDFDGSARHELLDLSLADGRFAPDVLEVAARRVVAAWAEAVEGDDAPLTALATAAAVQTLLHGDDTSGDTRLVVRGPEVRGIRVAGLNAAVRPARVELEVQIKATRYTEDRATGAVVRGRKELRETFTAHWTLALEGPDESPWRLVTTA